MIGTTVVKIAGLDVTCLVDDVAINHGRSGTTDQPTASTATLNVDLSAGLLPTEVEIGANVVVTTRPDPDQPARTRFKGRVTDVALGWDDAGVDTPVSGVGQIVAAGPLADLGRRVIGDEPWPAELDGARVSRALALAGVDLDPLLSDPGTVTILPRDVDKSDALSIVDDTAQTAAGVVWETAAGEVRYHDADHRRGVDPAVTLDACDLLVTPAWVRTTDGMVNTVTLAYGTAPGGGEQSTVSASNAKSIAKYGVLDYSASTTLAEYDDAFAMANLLVSRNATPVWVMAALPVDVASLDDATTLALLDADLGDLIYLTGLPAVSHGVPTTAYLWVEGWVERLAWDAHDLAVTVSGYCRTSPPPLWDDVDPDWTWDGLAPPSNVAPPALTWDDLTCLGPTTHAGRWTDVPSSNRWDTTPAEITWDTWDQTATRDGADHA